MSANRRNLLLVLTVIVIILLALGWFTIPLATPVLAKGEPPPNVIVTLVPFIFFLFGIILALITLIIFLATVLNHRVAESVYRPITIVLVAGVFIGVLGMIQPWQIVLFKFGFLLLFICTLGYIIWSHIVPRGVRPVEVGTISASKVEQQEALHS